MDITAGRYRARLVTLDAADAALALRAQVFRGGADDADAFDAVAQHLLIEEEGALRASARLWVQRDRVSMRAGYTGRRYDLTRFSEHFPQGLEVGRICLARGATDPDLPRLMLAALARVVEETGVPVLYGCSSFPRDGTGMARLDGHIAPEVWAPGSGDGQTVPIPDTPGDLPPMLRSYLALGASVSDHAVVDEDLNTLHVFTALPIAAIPPARVRLLTGMLSPA
ncbi:GNAT family N-acyltransferase [Jannaschia pohangensis]|uniref:Ornithine-acyl[acyl carrier protein] N-acyltransferase n=1 Tax=Jannaschia pohangensis TaxID=390807 RepID=A0A1I3SE43_9RHOB|nr:GNAT family N-acyltransferase [Jannaschia pohangensis]SFJ56222.1 ornithine-acyl[acyl carrier protein] N-acyltransferase [Jannaschia pohangensis]